MSLLIVEVSHCEDPLLESLNGLAKFNLAHVAFILDANSIFTNFANVESEIDLGYHELHNFL